jgi:hypothetical protein
METNKGVRTTPDIYLAEKKISTDLFSVTPSAIVIKNVHKGVLSQCFITVQNLSAEIKNIQISISGKSGTSDFTVGGTISNSLTTAPGLDKKVKFEFIPKESRNYEESIIIKCEKSILEIPIQW